MPTFTPATGSIFAPKPFVGDSYVPCHTLYYVMTECVIYQSHDSLNTAMILWRDSGDTSPVIDTGRLG